MECTNCPDAEKCGRKLELAIAGVTGWKCLNEFSLENVIEHLNTLMDRRVLSDEWTDMIGRAVELLKEQPHWIPVEERLPTYAELKDERVLVLFDDGNICSTGFDECIENESIFGEWRQNFDPVTLGATDSYWMPLEGVTHWMPIPKMEL